MTEIASPSVVSPSGISATRADMQAATSGKKTGRLPTIATTGEPGPM